MQIFKHVMNGWDNKYNILQCNIQKVMKIAVLLHVMSPVSKGLKGLQN